MNQLKRRYFDTFDGLRFFAFMAVFLGHLPSLSVPYLDVFQHSSGLGVKFFFTLSGFLITYLILEEKERTGKLNIGNFFMRRILKIWPLYYLMLLFAYCTPFLLNLFHLRFSNEGYEPNWLLSVSFLENYKMIAEHQMPNTSPMAVMWSLCVEEHFYIIWGIVFYFLSMKRVPILIACCLLIAFISKFIFIYKGWSCADILTNLDTFSFGAIPAYLLIKNKEKFECQITNIPLSVRWGVILCTIFFVIFFYKLNIPAILSELLFSSIFCLLFSMVIMIVIPQKNTILLGQSNVFSKLGKYTYGLYLYHTIIISLFIQLFKQFSIQMTLPLYSFLFFVISLLLVVLISIISYNVFEKKFLSLKNYFNFDKRAFTRN